MILIHGNKNGHPSIGEQLIRFPERIAAQPVSQDNSIHN